MRRHASLVVFVVWVLLALTPTSRANDPGPFKVPFETLTTQHIVVMVKINGTGPYRLIFDTGAPITLLSNKAAKAAGVLTKNDKQAGLLLLGEVPQYKIQTLELGELKAENLKTMVMDHPTVGAIGKALGPIEGIIGLTFFGKYKMTIDYQAKEMTFVPVDFTPPDVIKGMMAFMKNPGQNKKVLAPAGQWGFSVNKDTDDDAAGVTVKEVFPSSAAAQAGLKVGDRLLTLDGRWTDSVVDFYQAATVVHPGTAARLTLLRDGKEIPLTVIVRTGF
jgi:Aspartyl protease/PDZ domain